MASGSRLGDGRADHRQPDAERRDGAEDDCRSRRTAHGPAHVRVQGCSGDRHHHAARTGAGPDETRARAHRRQVHEMNTVVTGSIAYDYLMSFPGKFTEHFLPEHMNRVSLSFLVDSMDKRRGGCAPNIAYTLALLGERPLLMATAGEDFGEYRQWLEAAGIDTTPAPQIAGKFRASFFWSTDGGNKPIAAFFTGAMADARQRPVRRRPHCALAI